MREKRQSRATQRLKTASECRLAKVNPDSLSWQPKDCTRCPVPAILRANGHPDMVLSLTIKRGILGLGRKAKVSAFCRKHRVEIEEPPVGCPLCNAERPGMAALFGKMNG